MSENLKSQKFFIILSILYIVTGAVIIVWPNMSMEMLGKAIGIGMLVLGLTHITIYFTKDHMQQVLQMDLTMGVVLASFGAFILMHADFVKVAIPLGVGILLMIGAMTKIQHAIDMRRMHVKRWKAMICFAVILIAVGLVLLYNPFPDDKDAIMVYVIAGSLILDGILNIFSVLFLSHRVRQFNRGFVPDENGRMRLPKTEDTQYVKGDVAGQSAGQSTEDEAVDGEIVPYK